MLKQVIKNLLGVLAIPVCAAVSLSFYEQLNQTDIVSSHQQYFIYGIISYLIIHILFFKPEYIYIFGHELMHVLATWASGGKVTSFKVSPRGGKITASKNNIFIALAPYFFPFYTILVAVIFFICTLFINTEEYYAVFLFLLGLTIAFHIILTVDFLKIRQTDFLHAGYLFSICLIYIANVIVLGVILNLLFERANSLEFFYSIYNKSRDIYTAIIAQLFF